MHVELIFRCLTRRLNTYGLQLPSLEDENKIENEEITKFFSTFY